MKNNVYIKIIMGLLGILQSIFGWWLYRTTTAQDDYAVRIGKIETEQANIKESIGRLWQARRAR